MTALANMSFYRTNFWRRLFNRLHRRPKPPPSLFERCMKIHMAGADKPTFGWSK